MSHRLVIMGPQGSGKGTQSARLAKLYGIPAISTGDIFRAHIKHGTDLGKLAQDYTNHGELVPDEVTDSMVRERLAEPDCVEGFILDGYPRNAAQVEALDETLHAMGWDLDGVVELKADHDELLARLIKRAREEGRPDDTPDVIDRRLTIYEEQTMPLTEGYHARNLLAAVDGKGDVAEVTVRIRDALNALPQH